MPGPYYGDDAVAGVWNYPGGAAYAAAGDTTWYIVPTADEVLASPSGFGLWCDLTLHGLVLLEEVQITDFFVNNALALDIDQKSAVTINGDTAVLLTPPLTSDVVPALGVYPAGTLFELWANRNGTSVSGLTSPGFAITIAAIETPAPSGGIYLGSIALEA